MKNKIIYILLLVILLVFILNSYSLAFDVEVNGTTYSIPALPSAISSSSHYVVVMTRWGDAEYYTVCYSNVADCKIFYDGLDGYGRIGLRFVDSNGNQCSTFISDCDMSTLSWGDFKSWGNLGNCKLLLLSSDNIYNDDGTIYFSANASSNSNPRILNTADDLSSSTYDSVIITPGTLTLNDKFNFIIRKCSSVNLDEGVYESQNVVFNAVLDFSSPYYKDTGSFVVSEFWYEIPRNSLGISFNNGDKYIYSLEKDGEVIQDIVTTVGGLTEEDKELNRFDTIKDAINQGNKETANAIKDTTNAIKEQTEVSKNIFQKIGDILSFINPFSENFFGRKLVELILDGLKSLFVPSDDFFTNWFDDMNSWLGDRFGILYFPTEIVLDFLNRVGGLSSSSSCSLTIPQLKINFFGNEVVVFNGYTYDFNELLVNDTFKNIHTIYLTVVDVILYLCLIVLAHNAFATVFGGRFIDEVVDDVTADERSYQRYKRSQDNSSRYKREYYSSVARNYNRNRS